LSACGGGPADTGRATSARLFDLSAVNAELADVGDHVAVMPGDVAEREDGLVADHLPVGGVERAAVLRGEGALSVSDRVGLELEVGGGLADEVGAIGPVRSVVLRVREGDVGGCRCPFRRSDLRS